MLWFFLLALLGLSLLYQVLCFAFGIETLVLVCWPRAEKRATPRTVVVSQIWEQCARPLARKTYYNLFCLCIIGRRGNVAEPAAAANTSVLFSCCGSVNSAVGSAGGRRCCLVRGPRHLPQQARCPRTAGLASGPSLSSPPPRPSNRAACHRIDSNSLDAPKSSTCVVCSISNKTDGGHAKLPQNETRHDGTYKRTRKKSKASEGLVLPPAHTQSNPSQMKSPTHTWIINHPTLSTDPRHVL